MLERKNSDFTLLIASVVQDRFHNLMVKHRTIEKHGTNESYQLSTVYKNECHCSQPDSQELLCWKIYEFCMKLVYLCSDLDFV